MNKAWVVEEKIDNKWNPLFIEDSEEKAKSFLKNLSFWVEKETLRVVQYERTSKKRKKK